MEESQSQYVEGKKSYEKRYMLYESSHEILGKEKLIDVEKGQNGSCLKGEWNWGFTNKRHKETFIVTLMFCILVGVLIRQVCAFAKLIKSYTSHLYILLYKHLTSRVGCLGGSVS